MSIDLDDIESRINDGIYGDDRMTDTGRDDAFSALAVLLAEVERLRGEVERERAAVVAWLRAEAYLTLYEASPWQVSDAIERGDHVKEVTDGPA
jgi:hypothetical protein